MRLLTVAEDLPGMAVGFMWPSVFPPDFFDIGDRKYVPAFTFIDLDSCALVMDYW